MIRDHGVDASGQIRGNDLPAHHQEQAEIAPDHLERLGHEPAFNLDEMLPIKDDGITGLFTMATVVRGEGSHHPIA